MKYREQKKKREGEECRQEIHTKQCPGRDRRTESMPVGFCVTGKGVYPEDRLWNVEEAKPGPAMFFRDVYVKFDLDAVR